MKSKINIYTNTLWKSMDEYYELAMKHKLWGKELEAYLKKELKKEKMLEPKIKPKTYQDIYFDHDTGKVTKREDW